MSLKPILVAAALLTSLSAAAQPAPKRPRVAVLEVRALGIAPEKAALLSEVALTEASGIAGLDVIGRSDIQSMIGFEKEKQMLGCSEDSKCITEIAGAMGVDWILVGSLGQLDALYRLDLKLIEAKRSRISGRIGESIEGSQSRLVSATQAGVHKLLDPIAKNALAAAAAAAARPPPAPVKSPPPPEPAAAKRGEAPAPVAAVAAPASEAVTPVASPGGGVTEHLLFAVRLALMRPAGNIYGAEPPSPDNVLGSETVPMTTMAKSNVSVGADLAWRLGSGFAAGVYLEGGPDFGTSNCGALSCSATMVRGGLQGLWEERFDGKFRWWGAVGAGYERSNVDIGVGSVTYKGFEYLNLKGGADFRFGPFTLGPFITLSVGEYRWADATISYLDPLAGRTVTKSMSQTINARKLHSWYGLGVRGTYGP